MAKSKTNKSIAKPNKPAKKNKGGRPSEYRSEYAKQVYLICREFGATVHQIAKVMNRSTETIDRWGKKYPEFSRSIKRGRDEFDTKRVEKSLLGRALGYNYTEEYEEEQNTPTGIVTKTKAIHKKMAPDVTAQIFWLKNRQPERWRDRQQIEHSGTVQQNTVDVNELLSSLSLEAKKEILKVKRKQIASKEIKNGDDKKRGK